MEGGGRGEEREERKGRRDEKEIPIERRRGRKGRVSLLEDNIDQ